MTQSKTKHFLGFVHSLAWLVFFPFIANDDESVEKGIQLIDKLLVFFDILFSARLCLVYTTERICGTASPCLYHNAVCHPRWEIRHRDYIIFNINFNVVE